MPGAQFDQDKPAGSQKLRLSDDDIRNNNYAVQDAIGRDHKFPTGYGVDAGEHTRVKFTAPIVSPTAVANKCYLFPKDADSKVELHFLDEDGNEIQITSVGSLLGKLKLTPITTPTDAANMGFVYGKDVGGKIELHFLDEDGNEVQITSAGAIAGLPTGDIPSGTKMWFYADSAPTGWTLDATPSDELLAIKGGATYTAGAATAGTWTQTTHTHTVSVSGSNSMSGGAGFVAYQGSGTEYGVSSLLGSVGASGTTAASGPAATYRPKARVGIICSKDA